MELNNHFEVATTPDETWKILLDIERVAPCMPGAVLDGETEPGTYTGRVKVKVGPIVTSYKGTVTFLEQDEANHRAVLQANGKETHGPGTAQAKVVATLVGTGSGGTRVEVLTDLGLTGKPAQFGRGVLSEVSDKLIGQFATNLAREIGTGGAVAPADSATDANVSEASAAETGGSHSSNAAAAGSSSASSAPQHAEAPSVQQPAAASPTVKREPVEPEAIDLLGLAGGSVLKRVAPVLIGVVGGATVVFVLLRRRR